MAAQAVAYAMAEALETAEAPLAADAAACAEQRLAMSSG